MQQGHYQMNLSGEVQVYRGEYDVIVGKAAPGYIKQLNELAKCHEKVNITEHTIERMVDMLWQDPELPDDVTIKLSSGNTVERLVELGNFFVGSVKEIFSKFGEENDSYTVAQKLLALDYLRIANLSYDVAKEGLHSQGDVSRREKVIRRQDEVKYLSALMFENDDDEEELKIQPIEVVEDREQMQRAA